MELAHLIVDMLEEKKGEDILLLDLTGVCSFTDLFVISSARSARTLKALSSEVLRRLKSDHLTHPVQVEGDATSGWVLLDYGGVILHLFSPELRKYYALEELWQNGKVLLRMA
jgi:ribosome-associated protein